MVVADAEVASKWAYFFSRPGDALAASWDKIATTFPRHVGRLDGLLGVAITNTTREAAPLICAGLAVAVAFRAGLFNIGAQGQAMMGALAAAFVGFTVKGLPIFVHLPLVIIVGMARGRRLGRHRRHPQGPHRRPRGDPDHHDELHRGQPAGVLHAAGGVPGARPGGSHLPRPRVDRHHAAARRAPACTSASCSRCSRPRRSGGCSERTKFGINLQAIGLNPNAAATAGASVSNVTMITMALAGGLAGLAGVIDGHRARPADRHPAPDDRHHHRHPRLRRDHRRAARPLTARWAWSSPACCSAR